MIRGILTALLVIFITVHAQAADVMSTCNISPNPGENSQNKGQIASQMIGLGFQGTPSEAQIRCILNTPREGRRAKLQQMIADQNAAPVPADPGRIGTAVATNIPGPSEKKVLANFGKNASFTVKNVLNAGNTFMPDNEELKVIVWNSPLEACAALPKGISLQLNVDETQQKSYRVTCDDPNGCQAILKDPSDCMSQLTGNYSVTSNDAPPPPPTPLPPLPMISRTIHKMIVSQNDGETLIAQHGLGSASSDLPRFIKLKYSKFQDIPGNVLKSFLTSTTARLAIGLKCLNPQGCQLLCNNSKQNTGACGSSAGKISFFDLADNDYALIPPENLNIIGELTSTDGVTVLVESDQLIAQKDRYLYDDKNRGYKIPDEQYYQIVNYFKNTNTGSKAFSLKLNCQDPAQGVCRVTILANSPNFIFYEITGGALKVTPLQ